MTNIYLRFKLAAVAALLLVQPAFSQTTGLPTPEHIQSGSVEARSEPVPGTSETSRSTATVATRKYSSLLSRERSPIGQVIDSYMDFYPRDEYLRILSSSNRRSLIDAPFRMKSGGKGNGTAIPGASAATLSRLYLSDSSLVSLVAWYTREYGFTFNTTSAPFSEGGPGDLLTVARAVKSINNSIVTVIIWNPTYSGGGRRSKGGTYSAKTSVEVQERAFRPRSELVVEGPDAVVEFTWKVPYQKLIQQMSAKYQIDPYLLAALVQQESGFNANAMSVDSAMGLTQMIPGTAAMMGVRNPNNPHQSLDGGARYLKLMLRKFKGDPSLALAAYNAGPGNVMKYHGIPPFAETRDYVRRIMARYREKAGGRSATTAKVVLRS